ncbi:MAG: hypothetical protein HY321_22560 [Armatimonadetes bacterium]|nr:hypothetical protein [Armatimonadota bacterium]
MVDVVERGCEAAVSRESGPGLDVVTVTRQGLEELHLTLRPLPGEDSPGIFRRFAGVLRERGAEVVSQTILGAVAASREGIAALAGACGAVEWPVTWVEGSPCGGGGIAGIQAHAMRGVPVETLRLDGRVVGRLFADPWARHCLLGGLRPDDPAAPRPDQALRLFERMEAALSLAGMRVTDLARTWLFIDRLLSWYHEFNPVRTRFFTERGVFEGVVPASTGIEGRNPDGAAISAAAIAMLPFGKEAAVVEVESPLQCSARAYGSSFSRAVAVCLPDYQRLLVSGTASIEPGGRSAHTGDVDAQIDRTLRVVGAILESRGMSFADVSRAIAYFKRAADAPALERHCRAHAIPALPVALTHGDVCREDLLFEIELDAVRASAA